MVFNDAAKECLEAYFKQFPEEEERLKEAHQDQEISDDYFKSEYERLKGYTRDYFS